MEMLFQVLAAAVATAAFSLLFNAPAREYPFCAAAGGFCWLLYLLGEGWGYSPAFSSFLAATALCALCRLFSILRRTPVTVFLIPGIFPIVPGAGIYYTAYHLFMGDMPAFSAKGLETGMTAAAIALGILLVLALPLPRRHSAPRR